MFKLLMKKSNPYNNSHLTEYNAKKFIFDENIKKRKKSSC